VRGVAEPPEAGDAQFEALGVLAVALPFLGWLHVTVRALASPLETGGAGFDEENGGFERAGKGVSGRTKRSLLLVRLAAGGGGGGVGQAQVGQAQGRRGVRGALECTYLVGCRVCPVCVTHALLSYWPPPGDWL
jgi:hypothetical protein